MVFRPLLLIFFLIIFPANAQDYDVERLTAAANAGDTNAQFILGGYYLTGRNVEKDVHRGIMLTEKAANADNERAQYFLGNNYAYGTYTPKDIYAAMLWYKRAGEMDTSMRILPLEPCFLMGQALISIWKLQQK